MNKEKTAYYFFALGIPAVAFLALLTSIRVMMLIDTISASEIKRDKTDIESTSEQPVKEETVLPEKDDTGKTPSKEQIVIKGLPELVKKDSLVYIRIENLSMILNALKSISIEEIWNREEFQPALQETIAFAEGMWNGFLKKYGFPVDRIFKGLGKQAGNIEVVITDFTFFRGAYAIEIASVCDIVGDENMFLQAFRNNLGKLLEKRLVHDIEVYEKRGEHGILSVFVHKKKLYVVVGREMADSLIKALVKQKPAESFADNPGFKASYASRMRNKNGLFIYSSPDMLNKFKVLRTPLLKGPVSLYAFIENGMVHEELFIPYYRPNDIIKKGGAVLSSPASENAIVTINGRFGRKLIEALATFSCKIIGINFYVKVNKIIQGCFWDYLFILSDYTQDNTMGLLLWDENIPMPSWVFISKIKDKSKLNSWLKDVRAECEVALHPANEALSIISLKKELANFGSFCYIINNDMIYYSYSSSLLKEFTTDVSTKAKGNEDFLFELNVEELTEYLENKSTFLREFIKYFKWFDASQISDFTVFGKIVGKITGGIQVEDSGISSRISSSGGITPVFPLIRVIENKCKIMED